jgi:hypothetical protein
VPDDTKVFDVSKPGRAAPQSTSRPIIVDNNPTMSDPMMAENSASAPEVSAPLSTSIQVSMGDEEESVNVNKSPVPSAGTTFEPNPNEANSGINPSSMPEVPSQMPETLGSATIPAHELEETSDPSAEKKAAGSNFTPLTSLVPSVDSKEDKSSSGESKSHHIDSLPENHNDDAGAHVSDPLSIAKGSGPKKRGSKTLTWIFLAIIAAFVAAYLAVDAGLVKSNVNLPFHIFNKQKKSTVTTNPKSVA